MNDPLGLSDDPIYLAGGESILEVAARVDRSYWYSGASVASQAKGVANAVAPLVLEASNVDKGFHMAIREPLAEWLAEKFSHGIAKVTQADIDLAVAKCNATIPPIEKVRDAAETEGVIRVGSKHYWAQGLLAYMGERQYLAAKNREITEALTYMLDRTTHLDKRVADRTKQITDTVASWAARRGYRPARELSVPVITPGSTYFGRHDLVIFRKPNPTIVIEIDSRPNERSVPKLDFAHRSGAIPMWIRWNKGDAEDPNTGVTVIDFCDVPADA